MSRDPDGTEEAEKRLRNDRQESPRRSPDRD